MLDTTRDKDVESHSLYGCLGCEELLAYPVISSMMLTLFVISIGKSMITIMYSQVGKWSSSAVLAVGLLLPMSSQAASLTAPEVIALVNETRKEAKLSPYTASLPLTLAALRKGLMMYHTGVLTHVAADGTTPFTLVEATGYQPKTVGENLGFSHPTAARLITAMLSSPGHRANILSKEYTEIGVGVVPYPKRPGETMVVMVFASPRTATFR